MKKYYLLTIMALVLTILPVQAAIYMVGNTPFGDWNPAAGVEMTDGGNGIYTHTANISGTVWFVFSDGLDSDWNVFNANYRYGPASSSSEDVAVGHTYNPGKNNNNHAYRFTGEGKDYTFTFNLNQLTFSISEYQEPVVPDPTDYDIGDINCDGEINISDVTGLIEILLGGKANYDVLKLADVNYDNEVNITDVTGLIEILLGGQVPTPVKEGYDYVWDDDALPEIHLEVSLSEWNRLLQLYDANSFTTQ